MSAVNARNVSNAGDILVKKIQDDWAKFLSNYFQFGLKLRINLFQAQSIRKKLPPIIRFLLTQCRGMQSPRTPDETLHWLRANIGGLEQNIRGYVPVEEDAMNVWNLVINQAEKSKIMDIRTNLRQNIARLYETVRASGQETIHTYMKEVAKLQYQTYKAAKSKLRTDYKINSNNNTGSGTSQPKLVMRPNGTYANTNQKYTTPYGTLPASNNPSFSDMFLSLADHQTYVGENSETQLTNNCGKRKTGEWSVENWINTIGPQRFKENNDVSMYNRTLVVSDILHPFQKLLQLLMHPAYKQYRGNLCLAGVGTGKTYAGLASVMTWFNVIRNNELRKLYKIDQKTVYNVLVMSPNNNIAANWMSELKKLDPIGFDMTKIKMESRTAKGSNPKYTFTAEESNCILEVYFVRIDLTENLFNSIEWDLIIVDEAQYLNVRDGDEYAAHSSKTNVGQIVAGVIAKRKWIINQKKAKVLLFTATPITRPDRLADALNLLELVASEDNLEAQNFFSLCRDHPNAQPGSGFNDEKFKSIMEEVLQKPPDERTPIVKQIATALAGLTSFFTMKLDYSRYPRLASAQTVSRVLGFGSTRACSEYGVCAWLVYESNVRVMIPAPLSFTKTEMKGLREMQIDATKNSNIGRMIPVEFRCELTEYARQKWEKLANGTASRGAKSLSDHATLISLSSTENQVSTKMRRLMENILAAPDRKHFVYIPLSAKDVSKCLREFHNCATNYQSIVEFETLDPNVDFDNYEFVLRNKEPLLFSMKGKHQEVVHDHLTQKRNMVHELASRVKMYNDQVVAHNWAQEDNTTTDTFWSLDDAKEMDLYEQKKQMKLSRDNAIESDLRYKKKKSALQDVNVSYTGTREQRLLAAERSKAERRENARKTKQQALAAQQAMLGLGMNGMEIDPLSELRVFNTSEFNNWDMNDQEYANRSEMAMDPDIYDAILDDGSGFISKAKPRNPFERDFTKVKKTSAERRHARQLRKMHSIGNNSGALQNSSDSDDSDSDSAHNGGGGGYEPYVIDSDDDDDLNDMYRQHALGSEQARRMHHHQQSIQQKMGGTLRPTWQSALSSDVDGTSSSLFDMNFLDDPMVNGNASGGETKKPLYSDNSRMFANVLNRRKVHSYFKTEEIIELSQQCNNAKVIRCLIIGWDTKDLNVSDKGKVEKAKRERIDAFNDIRNTYGEYYNVIIGASDSREGISLMDCSFIHRMSTSENQEQLFGRGFRTCAFQNQPDSRTWQVHTATYTSFHSNERNVQEKNNIFAKYVNQRNYELGLRPEPVNRFNIEPNNENNGQQMMGNNFGVGGGNVQSWFNGSFPYDNNFGQNGYVQQQQQQQQYGNTTLLDQFMKSVGTSPASNGIRGGGNTGSYVQTYAEQNEMTLKNMFGSNIPQEEMDQERNFIIGDGKIVPIEDQTDFVKILKTQRVGYMVGTVEQFIMDVLEMGSVDCTLNWKFNHGPNSVMSCLGKSDVSDKLLQLATSKTGGQDSIFEAQRDGKQITQANAEIACQLEAEFSIMSSDDEDDFKSCRPITDKSLSNNVNDSWIQQKITRKLDPISVWLEEDGNKFMMPPPFLSNGMPAPLLPASSSQSPFSQQTPQQGMSMHGNPGTIMNSVLPLQQQKQQQQPFTMAPTGFGLQQASPYGQNDHQLGKHTVHFDEKDNDESGKEKSKSTATSTSNGGLLHKIANTMNPWNASTKAPSIPASNEHEENDGDMVPYVRVNEAGEMVVTSAGKRRMAQTSASYYQTPPTGGDYLNPYSNMNTIANVKFEDLLLYNSVSDLDVLIIPEKSGVPDSNVYEYELPNIWNLQQNIKVKHSEWGIIGIMGMFIIHMIQLICQLPIEENNFQRVRLSLNSIAQTIVANSTFDGVVVNVFVVLSFIKQRLQKEIRNAISLVLWHILGIHDIHNFVRNFPVPTTTTKTTYVDCVKRIQRSAFLLCIGFRKGASANYVAREIHDSVPYFDKLITRTILHLQQAPKGKNDDLNYLKGTLKFLRDGQLPEGLTNDQTKNMQLLNVARIKSQEPLNSTVYNLFETEVRQTIVSDINIFFQTLGTNFFTNVYQVMCHCLEHVRTDTLQTFVHERNMLSLAGQKNQDAIVDPGMMTEKQRKKMKDLELGEQHMAINSESRDQCYIVWNPKSGKSLKSEDIRTINGDSLRQEFQLLHDRLTEKDRNMFMQWYHKGNFKTIIDRDGATVQSWSKKDLCMALGGIYFPFVRIAERGSYGQYYAYEDEWMLTACIQFGISPSFSPPGYMSRLAKFRDTHVLKTINAVIKHANHSKTITSEEQTMCLDCLQIMMAALEKRRNTFVTVHTGRGNAEKTKQVNDWRERAKQELAADTDPSKTKVKTKLYLTALQYLGERVEEHLHRELNIR